MLGWAGRCYWGGGLKSVGVVGSCDYVGGFEVGAAVVVVDGFADFVVVNPENAVCIGFAGRGGVLD